MKLGSLFDGSGGFPLAGTLVGMVPVWASEIEPYPIRVTTARFPHMKHLGNITQISGAQIEPVDVITFGSPCQDLSVAGKQKGIHEGERSNLFFEAIRIIHEMREATDHKYPRYAVWENVPGAFSSNKGHDFRAVLQAFCDEADQGLHVPLPQKGKWQHAGCVVGDGFSVAWRQYDAQFWGVPQRRKRIYLVADFGSERAGEILFEREGVRWYPPKSGETREGTAEDVERCAGGSCKTGCVGAFMGGQGSAARGIGWSDSVAPTIKSVMSGSNQVPDVVYACNAKQQSINVKKNKSNTLGASDYKEPQLICYPSCARSLTARHDGSPCIDRGPNFVCYAPNGNHCGAYEKTDCAATLNTRYHYGSGGDAAIVLYDTTQITSPMNYSNPKPGDPCHPIAANQHPPLLVKGEDHVDAFAMEAFGKYRKSEIASALKARDYKDATDLVVRKVEREYIVRRLTPLECCRLQGFPDWWMDDVEGSDSAKYKMWGNGIALPCAVDVLGRLKREE